MTRTNREVYQVCPSTHVDEVVPSRLLTRRGVFFLFPFREVSFGCRALFVCLCTMHVSVVSRLRPRSEPAPN